MRGSPSRSQTSAVALEVCTRCDDDEPQLIRCPHRDHVAFEQRPIRIIRDYRILTLPLHLRKRGRSVLPNMMQVMNAITPFMKQPRRSRPRRHEREVSTNTILQ